MKKNIILALAGLMFCSGSINAENNATQKAGAPTPDWMHNAVIYEANLRQATPERTLKAMQRQLPRLRDLGVDIVWLMPVHPISEKNRKGTMGSYYGVKDYKDINPQFGNIQDLREFISTAHTLGLKVILDEVCNHTGCDNSWTLDHLDFYAKNEKGEMFGPFDWTDTYQLDYSNPQTRAAMMDVLEFWVRELDVDGFRCDVAMLVPTDFWEEVRTRLNKIKPVFMLAEASKPDLLNKAFNADYAWPMKDLFNAIAATQGVNNYAIGNNQKLPQSTAADIPALLDKMSKEFPQGAVHMNMVTNHDLNSWEGTEFERYGNGLGAFAVLSYTLPGMPMMYTGQEVGFNHAFEFFENDSVQPDYSHNEFTTFYEILNSLKHRNPALRVADDNATIKFYPTSDKNILCFSRDNGPDHVLTIVNLSNKTAKLKFKKEMPEIKRMKNVFTSEATDKLPKELGAWEYLVLSTK